MVVICSFKDNTLIKSFTTIHLKTNKNIFVHYQKLTVSAINSKQSILEIVNEWNSENPEFVWTVPVYVSDIKLIF